MPSLEERMKTCKLLGMKDLFEVHKIITQGATKHAAWLIGKGLNSRNLHSLGYTLEAMKRLGYQDNELRKLGFLAPYEEKKTTTPTGKISVSDKSIKHNPRELVDKGYRANKLKEMGITLHHCKIAGLDPRELSRAGYDLWELREEFSLELLRAAGFNPRDLRKFYTGHQMQSAGFSAREMRCAGYSVRDLLNFGYNENHIISAGYRTADLIQAGLSRLTRDMNKLNRL